MSIVTKTGDKGTTALMFGRRVMKNNPRIEACGSVDELNSAIGLARATAEDDFIRERLRAIQLDLIVLMGETAVQPQDLERYVKEGYSLVKPDLTAKLEGWVAEIEAQHVSFKGWATPGATVHAAALDVARATCRRAERNICALHGSGELHNGEIIIYLNRLADLLWLLARWVETKRGVME